MRSSAATHPETAADLKGNGRISAAADVAVTVEIFDVVACAAVVC